jgi:hypothetical protein
MARVQTFPIKYSNKKDAITRLILELKDYNDKRM